MSSESYTKMKGLLDAVRLYPDDRLLTYLQNEIVKEEKNQELMNRIKCKNPKSGKQLEFGTALQMALYFGRSKEVIFKIIEIGGKYLVMINNKFGDTVLHTAFENEKTSAEVALKLIDLGGRELVIASNQYGKTALHNACENKNASVDAISKLIEVGGKELVMVNSPEGFTALNVACKSETASARMGIISKMLEVGGRELVMLNHKDENTVLHYMCKNEKGSFANILSSMQRGQMGNQVGSMLFSAMMNGGQGGTGGSNLASALQQACDCNEDASMNIIISKLIEVGGRDLLMQKNKRGYIALHHGYFKVPDMMDISSVNSPTIFSGESFPILVRESILAGVGGEFGIGGLFNVATPSVQEETYKNWDFVHPVLKSLVNSLQEEQKPPILHAAILAKAPLKIIRNIITHFEYSILRPDSLNRYPIEVALEEGLEYSKGLKEILKATAFARQQQPTKIVYTAAKYGLKWRHHMKELVKANANEIVSGGSDSLTGLQLFMVAAMGDTHDLSGIYCIMRMNPASKNL